MNWIDAKERMPTNINIVDEILILDTDGHFHIVLIENRSRQKMLTPIIECQSCYEDDMHPGCSIRVDPKIAYWLVLKGPE